MVNKGDRVPVANFYKEEDGWSIPFSSESLFLGNRVLFFAVSGAFTRICSDNHLPGYISSSKEIKSKGIDCIVCLSTNDALVLGAWARHYAVEDITMVSDGNGEFTRLMGLEVDETQYGMGFRSQRYAMIINDGKVEYIAIDKPGEVLVSSAEEMIKKL